MGRPEHWTEERIRDLARGYDFISDFQKDYSGAVSAIKKRHRHLKNELFPVFKKLIWSEERILEEALKYGTRSDFRENAQGAYSRACQIGITEKACSHMTNNRLKGDFDLGPYVEISGIYFLIQGDDIVYIGKSNDCMVERIRDHYKDKSFNEVRMYPMIKLADIFILETFLITTIKPKYNIEFMSSDTPTVEILNIDDVMPDYITVAASFGVNATNAVKAK